MTCILDAADKYGEASKEDTIDGAYSKGDYKQCYQCDSTEYPNECPKMTKLKDYANDFVVNCPMADKCYVRIKNNYLNYHYHIRLSFQ